MAKTVSIMENQQRFIDPKLLDIYLWLPTDDENIAEIIFSIPESCKKESIIIELRNDNKEIYVGIEGMPPFLSGTLFDQVKDLKKEFNDGLLRIKLQKVEKKGWDFIIKAPTETTNLMDPRSSFSLSQFFFAIANAEQEDPEKATEMMQLGNQYLKYAVACRYPDALVMAASITMSTDIEEKEKSAATLLSIAADEYDYPQAHFVLGLILVQNEDTVSSSIPHFESAFKGGIIDALNALGEIYSPEQVPHTKEEDAEKAVQCFEGVLKVQPDHAFALSNMARLLATGKGVKKDTAKAKDYLKKAMELNPEIEPFEIKEEEREGKQWIKAAAVATVVAGTAVAAVNLMKKRK
jgi:tetratricopeptide (TPR) repeat protein